MSKRVPADLMRPAVLMLIACCESLAFGLIFPAIPILYAQMVGPDHAPFVLGIALAIYAFANMLALPVLGAISDRFGRRPVIFLSLAILTIDFLAMAFVPILPVLLVLRMLSGLANSTLAIVAAALADITPIKDRTRRFGYLNASYGVGFFIGPLVGGVLYEYSSSAPYVLAASVAFLGGLMTILLPDNGQTSRQADALTSLDSQRLIINPFKHFAWLGVSGLAPLAVMFFALAFSFESPNSIWGTYLGEHFELSPGMIGATMGLHALLYTLVQLLIAGFLSARLGTIKTAIVGVCIDAVSMVALAFTVAPWVLFPLLVPLSLGSIAFPALQSLMSRQVTDGQQGRLQGAISSVHALASTIAPVACGALYALTANSFPGAVWLLPALLYAAISPACFLAYRRFSHSRSDYDVGQAQYQG